MSIHTHTHTYNDKNKNKSKNMQAASACTCAHATPQQTHVYIASEQNLLQGKKLVPHLCACHSRHTYIHHWQRTKVPELNPKLNLESRNYVTTHMYVCIYVCMYICMCIRVYIGHIYTHIYIYTCIYIYIYHWQRILEAHQQN